MRGATYDPAMRFPLAAPRRSRALIPLFALVLAACASSQATPTPSPSGDSPVPVTPRPTPSSGGATREPSPASSPSPAGPFDPDGLAIEAEPLVGGLDSPLAVTHAGDGSGRLFVVEQDGRIRIVRDGELVEAPFLDLADRVRAGGEQGLLGLAFHPAYPDDPRLFVNYTDERGDTIVASYTVDPADPDRADPGSEVPLLLVNQPFANHNGGALAFDADGFLLIATGDGGGGGDPEGNGQDPNALLGKILRIDIDGGDATRPYAIPGDNPFAVGGGAPEAWLVGLRNPWRLSVDRATGDVWIGDVGQGAWEEIDVQRAATPGGANFGWNRMEGAHCYRPAEGCEDPGLVLPAAEYSHDFGCTVIGGYVYRGTGQPALAGGYLFADFCSGTVWAIDPSVDGLREPVIVAETGLTISSFGEDEAGELYVTDLSAGTVSTIIATRD